MNCQHVSHRHCALSTLLSLVVSVFTVTGQAHAQCQYDVTVLQYPIDCEFGLPVITSGLSLNENGAVVGYYYCPTWEHDEAFLWTAEGGFVTLDRPPGVSSAIPTDINDHGVICGTIIVADIGFRGFVYDHGEWTVLPPVEDMLGTWSSAAAISNAGVVVGQRSITDSLNPQNAYIWSAAEGFTDLGVMNGPNSAARDISEAGVVGWTGILAAPGDEAFLYQNGDLTLLGPIPQGIASWASAVNGLGNIAGGGIMDPVKSPDIIAQPAVWNDGNWFLLGLLPRCDQGGPGGINDALEVVGVCGNSTIPNQQRGFLWRDGVMRDLNDLLAPDSEILIRRGKEINSYGLILADGVAPNGIVTFLMTPLEPPLGDLNADCHVGIVDLLELLASWGPCPPMAPCSADLDGDGEVGIMDLLILLTNWG